MSSKNSFTNGLTTSTISMAQTVITTKHNKKHQRSARKQVAIIMASLYNSLKGRIRFLCLLSKH